MNQMAGKLVAYLAMFTQCACSRVTCHARVTKTGGGVQMVVDVDSGCGGGGGCVNEKGAGCERMRMPASSQ